MAHHTATVVWERSPGDPFTGNRFSRGHAWSFDGGLTVRASSSPSVVPRFSDPSGVDPEEALRRSNEKFSNRFRAIERGVQAAGKTMETASLTEMEEHYQQAKRNGL